MHCSHMWRIRRRRRRRRARKLSQAQLCPTVPILASYVLRPERWTPNPGHVLRRSTMDSWTQRNQLDEYRMVNANQLLLQWCCIPLLEIEERKDKKKLCMHGKFIDCITYQLPSTIREVSSFSCWLLNLDKVGRLLLILSGRNLESLGNKILYSYTLFSE